jgi:hypothetical protein
VLLDAISIFLNLLMIAFPADLKVLSNDNTVPFKAGTVSSLTPLTDWTTDLCVISGIHWILAAARGSQNQYKGL